jgi:aminopeptidase N
MYLKACADGKRTAIDIPLSEFEQLMATPEVYDYNSSVIHGKSGAIMAKIKAMIGKEAFFRALSKLLQGYAGRSIDRHAFLKAIRDESGRDYAKELHHWLKTDDCITGDTP